MKFFEDERQHSSDETLILGFSRHHIITKSMLSLKVKLI
jgi:hypothetical protein